MADDADLRKFGVQRYIRYGNLASNLDVKTYDVGTLFVGTVNTGATLLGEVWVEYEVELSTPQYDTLSALTSLSAKIVGASPSAASYLGTTPTITGGLSITATANTITFNRVGQYLLTFVCIGTGMSTAFAPANTGTATYSTLLFNATDGGISNAAANAGTAAMWTGIVTVSTLAQTVTFNLAGTFGTVSATTVRLAPYQVSLG